MLRVIAPPNMVRIMSEIWFDIFSGAPERHFDRGASVFRRDDRVTHVYYVREGGVALARSLADGGALTLHRVRPGSVVAEASLFSDRYHCDGICEAPARLAVLSRAATLAALAETGRAMTALARSAREVQALRARVEVMRLKTLRARLDAYLELQGPPGSGEWVQVADWIGVTPEALYRELARRRSGSP